MCKNRWSFSPLAQYISFQSVLICAAVSLAMIDQYQYGDRYRDSVMPYIGVLFDMAGTCAFFVVITHVVSQCWLSWKWRCITTVTLLLLYVTSYCVVSYQGNYHASRSGLHRILPGLSMIDQGLWHAKGVFWEPFVDVSGNRTYHATILGYFYSPLICLDRAYIHRTIHLMDE